MIIGVIVLLLILGVVAIVVGLNTKKKAREQKANMSTNPEVDLEFERDVSH